MERNVWACDLFINEMNKFIIRIKKRNNNINSCSTKIVSVKNQELDLSMESGMFRVKTAAMVSHGICSAISLPLI